MFFSHTSTLNYVSNEELSIEDEKIITLSFSIPPLLAVSRLQFQLYTF